MGVKRKIKDRISDAKAKSYYKPWYKRASGRIFLMFIAIILFIIIYFITQVSIGYYHAKKGDILVGISASGNSKNLISAFEHAAISGIKTIALSAFDGGKLRKIADYSVHIPTEKNEYGPAEDLHMILDHLVGSYLMRLVKK